MLHNDELWRQYRANQFFQQAIQAIIKKIILFKVLFVIGAGMESVIFTYTYPIVKFKQCCSL